MLQPLMQVLMRKSQGVTATLPTTPVLQLACIPMGLPVQRACRNSVRSPGVHARDSARFSDHVLGNSEKLGSTKVLPWKRMSARSFIACAAGMPCFVALGEPS